MLEKSIVRGYIIMALRDEFFQLTDEQREGLLECSSLEELEMQINRTREYLTDDAIEAIVGGRWKRPRGIGRKRLPGKSVLTDSFRGFSEKLPPGKEEAAVQIGLFQRYFFPSDDWEELVSRARENESRLKRLYPKEEVVFAACRLIAGENEAYRKALQSKEDAKDFCESCLTMRGPVKEGRRRRLIREQARFVEYMGEGAPIPDSPDGFLKMWDRANRLEPRLYDDLPAHFRTRSDPVPFSGFLFSGKNGPVPEGRKTSPPEKISEELSRLLKWIQRQDLPSEMVALTACFLLEYIHPFPDGNGHTARMLCCGILQSVYGILTLTVFLEQIWAYRRRVFSSIVEERRTGADMCRLCCYMMQLLIQGQNRILENAQNKRL